MVRKASFIASYCRLRHTELPVSIVSRAAPHSISHASFAPHLTQLMIIHSFVPSSTEVLAIKLVESLSRHSRMCYGLDDCFSSPSTSVWTLR